MPTGSEFIAARARGLSEHFADAAIDISVDGYVLTWDERCEAITGVPASEALGRHINTLSLARLEGDIATWLSLQCRAGASWTEELIIGPEGVHVILKLAVVPLTDSGGRLIGYTILGRDARTAQPPEVDLATREAHYRRVAETAHIGIGIRDADGRFTYVNEHLAEMLGYEADEMIGLDREKLWMPEEKAIHSTDVLTHQLAPDQKELRYRRKDGSALWVLKESSPLYDSDHNFAGQMFTISDISRLVEAREKAKESSEKFRHFFEYSQVGVALAMLTGELIEVNPAFAQMLGYKHEDLVGRNGEDFLAADEVDQSRALRAELGRGGIAMTDVEHAFKHRDGHVVWLRTAASLVPGAGGSPAHLVLVFQDVSTRKAVEQKLAHQASHDVLTGLPNRSLLVERIRAAIEEDRIRDEGVALLFLDLDQFKLVNDALGHLFGDELLKAVAHRLESAVEEGETVARLGGDEFVVLTTGVKKRRGAESVAARVLGHLRRPFVVSGRQLFVTASIGVAMCTSDPEATLRNADEAMYKAKESGRNRFAVFEQTMRHRSSRHLRLASQLHDALVKDQFSLQFQPIVDLRGGGVTAFEALVRWQHPLDGDLEPSEFIPLAEDLGLIPMIGEWVTREACAAAAAWQKIAPGVNVHINVSPHELEDAFVGRLLKALGAAGLPPERVVVEITEMAVMPSQVSDSDMLATLSDLGVVISIDDFGTGYSSLAYLQRLPVDELKIDHKFVDRICESDADRAVVTSVIQLAHALGLRAVAEGVERPDQARLLASLGCDQGQGYFWGRPASAEELPAVLASIGTADTTVGIGRQRAATS